MNDTLTSLLTVDSTLSFAQYIGACRAMIKERRIDLQQAGPDTERIIAANTPFELLPANGKSPTSGVLLIHGLLDSPFSLREIGQHLQQQGLLCRSVLLPGHGTVPSDLLTVSYQDWLKTVRYGIESLRTQVERVFVVGYSTGAALALHHALQDTGIAGLILLAPALKIKIPTTIIKLWQRLSAMNHKNIWICERPEIDYVKYRSIGYHPVLQVTALAQETVQRIHQHKLSCPIFMVTSQEDETICSPSAYRFFHRFTNQKNQLLLYSAQPTLTRPQVLNRISSYPQLHIKHLSHAAIPFSAANFHYGENGDFIYASRPQMNTFIYGAYNQMDLNYYNLLHQLRLIQQPRKPLTFNPDFAFMANAISDFLSNVTTTSPPQH
ncbi:MAG TPA: alpha/beta fold hydrolase [Gammaproteobacteria bacterium]|jgi:esterase/lipase|nr:alpha/beta fold hydrolase [Gammaproteobacteria bacterium]